MKNNTFRCSVCDKLRKHDKKDEFIPADITLLELISGVKPEVLVLVCSKCLQKKKRGKGK